MIKTKNILPPHSLFANCLDLQGKGKRLSSSKVLVSFKICVVIMKRKLGRKGFCGLIWWNPVNVLLVIITLGMLFQIV